MEKFQFLTQASCVYDLLRYCVELLKSEKLDEESKVTLAFHLKSFENANTVSWAIEDVHSAANGVRKLTDGQAREVLNIMVQCHDAEQGICWQTITDTICIHNIGVNETE